MARIPVVPDILNTVGADHSDERGRMRSLRANKRGVLAWLWAVFGILAIATFLYVIIFAQGFAITILLLIIGAGVMLFAPKPHGIWIGLGVLLLGVFVFLLSGGLHPLQLAIVGH